MKTRIITFLLLAPIVWVCTFYGGIPFLLLILILAIASINEFYNMMMKRGYFPAFWVGNGMAIFFIVSAHYALSRNWEPAHSAILTLAVSIAAISGIFLKREKDTIADISLTLFGMVYIGWFFSYLIFIRSLTVHGGYLFFLLFTIWANDIVAYFVGRYFGRHKLAPQISPNKTWEGAIAGFLTCIIAAEIFSGIALINGTHAIILGAIIGIIAQFSDLIESLIKRDTGVKDSGIIFPGHGGALDRMDSFIFSAPLVYYYVVWFILK